jgi:hypothetical protein
MQIRATDNSEEFGKCGCGRSPTGKCVGWHGLDEAAYQRVKAEWQKWDEQVIMKNEYYDLDKDD